jgi:2-methylcitrate dehydratase PrpD
MTEQLMKEHDLSADMIDKLTIRIHPIPANCENYITKTVDNEMHAGFAGRYPLAASILNIEPGPEWLQPENFQDQDVEEFMKRIDIEEEPKVADVIEDNKEDAEAGYERMPASVEITAGSETYSKYTEYAKGDMWSPEKELRATDEELLKKFDINASGVLPDKKQESAKRVLTDLDSFKSTTELMSLFTP